MNDAISTIKEFQIEQEDLEDDQDITEDEEEVCFILKRKEFVGKNNEDNQLF